MSLGEVKRTERGFKIIEFKDSYGHASLQASSLAEYETPGTSAVWLGVDAPRARMHLNREQVKSLITHLTNWLERGTFSSTEPPPRT